GSVAHVSGELFKMMSGIKMQHVPYRGAAPALTDLIGGQVHVMFDNMPSSIEHIRAGRLRPLGVSTPTRLDVLPDVPPIAEFVPGYQTEAWAGLGAPKDTPAEVIETISREVQLGLKDAKLSARIAELGGAVLSLSPAGFAKLLADETE